MGSDKTELLPFPFCLNDAEIFPVGNRTHFSGGCSNCATRGPIETTIHEAAEAWNTRAALSKANGGGNE